MKKPMPAPTTTADAITIIRVFFVMFVGLRHKNTTIKEKAPNSGLLGLEPVYSGGWPD